MEISKHEAKAICFWLDSNANGQYYSGSYEDIELIYYKLSEFSGHKGKWKWNDAKIGRND